MIQGLYSVEEVVAMIDKGNVLLLAGDAALFKTLPKGKWIAGTTSKFIENGKKVVVSREKIFVHDITDIAADVKLDIYDASSIPAVYDDAYDNGFSVLIMPFSSNVKREYAISGMNYSRFASRPVCGWVAVAPIYSDYERNDVSLVFSGKSGLSYDDAGVAMHIKLPNGKYAELHNFNPFAPKDGDVILFEENGEQVENVMVNGVRQNFRQYMIDKQIDRSSKLDSLLVGDYLGIVINVIIMPESEIDEGKYVSIANPAYKDIPYRFAKLKPERKENYMKRVKDNIVFSFACIGNSEYPEMFKDSLINANGPFVYGEIAYILLNHSTVYVTVGDVSN